MKRLLFAITTSLAIFAGTLLILGIQDTSLKPVLAAPSAATYYVSSISGDDANACTTDAPCETIQRAVDLAVDGDEILIAALDNATTTNYTGTGSIPIVAVDKSIALRGGYVYIHIFGPGTWQRNPLLPVFSVIDGESQRQGLHVSGDMTVTLEWLSLNNGHASQGGNLYAEDATIRFSAVLVLSGTATHGGGAYLKNCQTDFDPINFDFGDLTDISGAMLVQNNTADYGGGLYIEGGEPSLSAFLINTNAAAEDGGGLYIAGGTPIIAGGIVLENTAGQRGGGLFLEQSFARIAGAAVYSNTASQGGGFYLDGPLVTWPIDVPIIANNYVRYNQGGAFYFYESIAGLVNNVIADNDGTDGSAATLWASSPQFYHNTIANNSGASAIYLNHRPSQVFPVQTLLPSLPRLINNIVASHTLGIYAESTGLIYPLENRATLEGTLWWGNDTQTGGSGQVEHTQSISGDPLFTCTGPIAECVNPYHIQDGSPAVDAGIDLLMALPDDDAFLTDIDTQLRPSGNGYDIGADEVVTISFNAWFIPPISTATGEPGDTVTHTHQLLNTGTQTDTYDLEVDSNTGWATLLTPTPLTLGTQASATVQVRVTIPAQATQGMSDTTWLTATSQADSSQTAQAIDTTFVLTQAVSAFDLEVDKQADVNNVDPGADIHYTLYVTKSEALTETIAVTLTDTLVPTDAVSAWDLPASCAGDFTSGVITCTWDMAPGTLHTALPITITSADPYSGTLLNVAIVSTSAADANPFNNVAQATVGIDLPQIPGLVLLPGISLRTANPGDTVTHTHTLRNTGSEADTFDLSFASDTGWATLVTPGPFTLESQATAAVHVRVVVPGSATGGMTDTTTLTATSRADSSLSATAVDRTFVISDVIPELGDIVVDKRADVNVVDPGGVIHYTILVTKSEGITQSVAVTLSDTFVPTQAVAAWDFPAPCTGDMDTGTITCQWMLPESSIQLVRTVPLVITTSTTISGSLVNIATVSASVQERDLRNNVDQVTVYLGEPERIYLPLVMRNFAP